MKGLLEAFDPSVSIPQERLERYHNFNNSNLAPIDLYLINITLSKELFLPLHFFEILLRNEIHNTLSKQLSEYWLLEETKILHTKELKKVLHVKSKLEYESKDTTIGRIISELSLGFWVNLLNSPYEEKLWRPHLSQGFIHRPKNTERKQLRSILEKIHRLRNRIAHYEPILHYPLDSNYKILIDIISWICPDTANWVDSNNQFIEFYSSLSL